MINFYDQVPSVYPSASRDFQYLSWLINIVINSVKHNVDDIYNLPSASSDTKLIELLAMTLGFKVKRNYDKKQLTALVAILPSVLKYKGTEKAVRMAAEALVKAAGALGDASTSVSGAELTVVLPKDLADITLFLDLLNYILPAGMSCRILRKNETKKALSDIEIVHKDTINMLVVDDYAWDEVTADSTGLSSLYNFGTTAEAQPDYLSNIKKLDDGLVLNAGLLNNTVIPVLEDSVLATVDESVELYSTEPDGANFALFAESGIADLGAKLKLKAKKPKQEL